MLFRNLVEDLWIAKGHDYAEQNDMADASRLLISSAFTVCAQSNAAKMADEIPYNEREPSRGPYAATRQPAYDYWYPESEEAFFKAIYNLYHSDWAGKVKTWATGLKTRADDHAESLARPFPEKPRTNPDLDGKMTHIPGALKNG